VGLVDLVGVMWLRQRSRLPSSLEEAQLRAGSGDVSPLEGATRRLERPGGQDGRGLHDSRAPGGSSQAEFLGRSLLHGEEA
jgi:hypothetical protein